MMLWNLQLYMKRMGPSFVYANYCKLITYGLHNCFICLEAGLYFGISKIGFQDPLPQFNGRIVL